MIKIHLQIPFEKERGPFFPQMEEGKKNRTEKAEVKKRYFTCTRTKFTKRRNAMRKYFMNK